MQETSRESTIRRRGRKRHGLLDSLLSGGGEELGLNDDRDLGQVAFAKNLEEAGFGDVNDESGILLASGLFARFLRNERPKLLNVDGRAEVPVALEVELAHTTLTVVARMILVHIDSLVVHATSETAAAR